MRKEFPTKILDNGVKVTYKVIANFRDSSISIYRRYNDSPYLKSYISTPFLDRTDIINIMFEYNTQELISFILQENVTCGKIKVC